MPRRRYSSSGGASGAGAFSGGGGLVLQAQADEKARVQRRVNLLLNEVPSMGFYQEEVLRLAQEQTDEDTMIRTAIYAKGAETVKLMADELMAMSPDVRRAQMATYSKAKQDALVGAGVTYEDNIGFMQRVGAALSTPTANPLTRIHKFIDPNAVTPQEKALGAVMGAVSKVPGGKPVVKGLGWALDAPNQTVNRAFRANEIMNDATRLQQDTGLSTQQLKALGIDAPAFDNPMSGAPGPIGALGMLMSPKDIYNYGRTFIQIGHKGQDDYLPSVQHRVYTALEEEFPGQGREMLQAAMGRASGDKLDDIASDLGMEGAEAEQFVAAMSAAHTNPAFHSAIRALESGRSSPGRALTRALWETAGAEEAPDTGRGWAKVVSGGTDFAWTLAADPTFVSSKLTVARRYARYGIKSAEDINYLQRAGLAVRRAAEGEDVAELVAPIARSWKQIRRDGEMANEFVDDLATVMAEGKGWGPFSRKYPGAAHLMEYAARYDAKLRAEGIGDLSNPDLGFEFLKHLNYNKSIVSVVDDSFHFPGSAGKRIFGNGKGPKIMPHMTNRRRLLMMADEKMRSWRGMVDPMERPPAAMVQAAAETVEALEPKLGTQLDEALALSDDATDHAIAEAIDAADAAPLEFDPALNLVRRPPGFIRRQIGNFWFVASQQVPKADRVYFLGGGDVDVEFTKLNSMLGAILDEPQSVIDARVDRWYHGSSSQRQALVAETLLKLTGVSGIRNTVEGDALIKEYVDNMNHTFGLSEAVGGVIDSAESSKMLRRMAIHPGQSAEYWDMPNFRELLVGTRQVNGLRMVAGGVRKGQIEAAMGKGWKPAQLLRFSFPLRAAADETLMAILRGGGWDYIRAGWLEPRAGINKDGVAYAPFQPIRRFGRMWQEVLRGTDEHYADKALELAGANDLDFRDLWKAGKFDDAEKLAKDKWEPIARANRNIVPRSVLYLAGTADRLATFASREFAEHIAAPGEKGSGQWLAKRFLETFDAEHAERVAILTQHVQDPRMEHALAEVVHNTIADVPVRGTNRGRETLIEDRSNPSGFRWVRMQRSRNQSWTPAQSDPSTFLVKYAYQARSVEATPWGAGALEEMLHHVDQRTFDDLGDLLRIEDDDVSPILALRNLRAKLRAAADEHTEGDIEQLFAKINELPKKSKKLEAFDPQVRYAASRVGRLSTKSRRMLVDAKLQDWKLTSEARLVRNRAANAVHRSLSSLPHQSDLKRTLSASVVDGRPIIRPVPARHDRLYGAMIDREQAEQLMAIFDNEDLRQSFREAVERQLMARNRYALIDQVWGPLNPAGDQMDLATAMMTVKAEMAQDFRGYIPGMYALSSDPEVAYAIRDAITDTIGIGTGPRPTIGFLDQPEEMYGWRHGLQKQGDGTVVAMAPHRFYDLEALDPDNITTLYQVRVRDPLSDRDRILNLTAEELEAQGRRNGVARMVKVKKRDTEALSEDRWDSVVVNTQAAHADLADGAKFLRGTGGNLSIKRPTYRWDDQLDADRAEFINDLLDDMGRSTDLQDIIRFSRNPTNRNKRLPEQDLLEDHRLLSDIERLKNSAIKEEATGRRWFHQETADASKVVRAALDEMGVDVDDLVSALSDQTYVRLLGARQQALRVLTPAGRRGPLTYSREAIELERDALGYALNEIGYPLPQGLRVRFGARWPEGKMGEEDFELLGTVLGSGVTEDAAVKAMTANFMAEVDSLFTGRQSGELLHNIVYKLRRGEFKESDLYDEAMAELPWASQGYDEIAPSTSWWQQLNNDFHEGFSNPLIGAVSRTPQFHNALIEAHREETAVLANMMPKADQAARAQAILKRFDISGGEASKLNIYVTHRVMDNAPLDPEDLEVAAIKAILGGDPDKAVKAIADWKMAAAANPIQQAQAAIMKMEKLTKDELTELANYMRREATAQKAFRERVYNRALEKVTPYIDDHTHRSLMQEYIGPMVAPYWYAEEQFLRRFARSVYDNPAMLRKGQLLMNGARNIGIIDTDANGNTVFVIPGSQLFTGLLADVATYITGNEAYQVASGPLTFRASYVLPGWDPAQRRFDFGPLVALGTDGLYEIFPELQWRADPDRRDWIEKLLPGVLGVTYSNFIKEPSPAQQMSAMAGAIAHLEASGQGLGDDPSPAEIERWKEDVGQAARAIGVFRALSGQLFLTKTSPADESAMFRSEFRQLLETGLDYSEALAVFMEGKDDAALAYTVFPTENETDTVLGTSTAAYQWMQSNNELITQAPYAAAFLIPNDSGFDGRAYKEQLALGLRRVRSPEEMLEAIRVRKAATDYYKAYDDHRAKRRVAKAANDDEAVRQLDEMWQIFSTSYKKRNPVFARSLTPEGANRRQATIEQMLWVTDPVLSGDNTQAAAIRQLVLEYRDFKNSYDAYKGQTSKVARDTRARELDSFFSWAWTYTQEYPEAADFFDSVIRPELPDGADDLEAAMSGAA